MRCLSASLSIKELINNKLKKVLEISVLYKYFELDESRIKEKRLKWGVINSLNVLCY